MAEKKLNLLDLFSITAGAMVSSGVFLLPGLAYAKVGPAVILAYLLASGLALTGVLSQAELASAMPKTGGSYFFIHRSLGPAVGTVYGLVTWLSLVLKAAFEMFGLAVLVTVLLHWSPGREPVIAALFCLPIIVVNLVGVKEAGRLQTALVFGILAVLLYYVWRGFPAVEVEYFKPFFKDDQGFLAVFSVTGFVFVSYGGLLKVASVAEEVEDPGRTLPLGMIVSLLVVTLVYLLVLFVTIGVLGPALSGSETPVYQGARAFLGRGGRIAVALASALAFVGAANAGVMASSRFPMALSRDGLVPRHLGRVNDRFKTPHVAILCTGGCMIAALFLPLDTLVKAASSVLILTYLFSCVAVVILRESRIQNYRPRFRTPFYPLLQAGGMAGCGFLVYEMGEKALTVSALLVAAGLVFYWFYGRIRSEREYALLHLVERITAKELTDHGLETELKEIIRERDDILKDRFDHLVEDCPVMDVKGSPDAETFFREAVSRLAPRLGVPEEELLAKVLERDLLKHTVINPYLAVPHVVVEGEHRFDLLLARSREGIHFSDTAPKVHAVFLLAGSRDERHFHLTALAALAQIVQDSDFEKQWMQAKTLKAIKDVVLLGKRKR